MPSEPPLGGIGGCGAPVTCGRDSRQQKTILIRQQKPSILMIQKAIHKNVGVKGYISRCDSLFLVGGIGIVVEKPFEMTFLWERWCVLYTRGEPTDCSEANGDKSTT